MDIEELLKILLSSDNDVWRDDAAEDLARLHWQNEESQKALIVAINSGKLDDSLIQTCLESLAEIWGNLGQVNNKYYCELSSTSKEIVDNYLSHAYKRDATLFTSPPFLNPSS
jgi:glycosyltransferase A (GT-A) superfamily protein (DUF2064 family)